MGRYFTFFLHGKKPSESQAILEFVDWLVQSTNPDGALQVIARREGEDLKSSIQGGFAERRSQLNGVALAALNVSSLKYTNAGSEFFFRYESGPGGPKTITFSLRSDLWAACERNAVSAQLRAAAERLFVSHDCLYGYGHPTHYIIPGRFSLIRAGLQPRVPRIVDFDYSRYIEDVYRYNYLSRLVLTAIDETQLRKIEGIEVKDMFDNTEAPAGLAIYLVDDSGANVARLRECLHPVLWPGVALEVQPLALPERNR